MGNSVTRNAAAWPDVHTHSKQLNAFMYPDRLFSWGTKLCSSKANRLNAAHSFPPLLIYTDTNVHVKTISRNFTWDKKCLIICRKCMATRRESTLHNNHRGHDGKRLNTGSFVLHIKGTIPDRSKQCQKHLIFDLCWVDVLLVWGRFQDGRAKIPWFYFLHCVLFLLILFNNIIYWVPWGKLHRYCLTGSHHRAYDHLSTLQVTGCIFQKLLNWPQWHGGSTCSFRGNEP